MGAPTADRRCFDPPVPNLLRALFVIMAILHGFPYTAGFAGNLPKQLPFGAALTPIHSSACPPFVVNCGRGNALAMSPKETSTLEKISEEDDVPIPFVDVSGSGFIECYADSIATVNGVKYTIGSPCDYAVALCYFDEDDQLIPVELDDDLLDDVFPVAESIVADEFGDELSLQRTPQTLTLVGELEEEEDEDEDEDAYDDDEEEDSDNGEEEVEILISFEHQGKEFHLVRLLDPVLLVGKTDPENPERRILLTAEESDEVMPELEELFLEFQEKRDSMTF